MSDILAMIHFYLHTHDRSRQQPRSKMFQVILALTVVSINSAKLVQVVALIKSCWKHEPQERPSMADVTEIMHDIVSRVKKRVKSEHINRPGHVVPHA